MAGSTANGSGPGQGPAPKKTYAVDVRVFLVGVTAAMALSFGLGVALGPSTAAEVSARIASPAGTGDALKQSQPRRLPTAHSVEIGERVRRDLNELHVNYETPSLEDLGGGEDVASLEDRGAGRNASVAVPAADQEEFLPAGQHLLVDIKNVEAAFLNSESRLADAMVKVVEGAQLTLLSYHCHSLNPGVSCVGVLLESHISFHTWPAEGVITLDLFTCGAKPLLPVVPDIEAKFGPPRLKAGVVPRADGKGNPPEDYETIASQWGHELRGFRSPQARSKNFLDDTSDLAFWVTSAMDGTQKEQIVSIETSYQRIDIWDLLDSDDTPTHEDAIKANLTRDDPRWLTNEAASPERLLFLDGTLQSMSESEGEYHEALVHPAMFAHPDPKRVAIVGGGEGATLREVLKHDTVDYVTMIELDVTMVEVAKEFLPQMSDCSDIEDSAPSCFDDERTDLQIKDGRSFFLDRKFAEDEKFNVVILDALDPEEETEIADMLYTDKDFLGALYDSMSDDGVMVIQVGTAPSILDPRPDLGVYSRRETMFRMIEDHPSTKAMFVYEEGHCGFLEPHSFLVVCKSESCRTPWYAESDAIDFAIHERMRWTESGEPILRHFDGSTQRSYQVPPRAWETVYCRREPEPFECAYRGLDHTKEMHDFVWDEDEIEEGEESAFDVRMVDGKPRVYANVDITSGEYVMGSDLASSFHIADASLENLKKNVEIVGTGRVSVIEDLLDYVAEHGHHSMAPGSPDNYVEVGGSFMMRRTENEAEANVGMWMPPHPSGSLPIYSPVYERRMRSFDLFLVATRNIKKGEEVVKHEQVWRQ